MGKSLQAKNWWSSIYLKTLAPLGISPSNFWILPTYLESYGRNENSKFSYSRATER
jgi:hypothetical protein